MGQKRSLFLGAKAILEFPLVYVIEFLPMLKNVSLKLRFFLNLSSVALNYIMCIWTYTHNMNLHVFLISKSHRENSHVCLTLWIILLKNVIQCN